MTDVTVVKMPEEKDLGDVTSEKTVTEEALEVLQVATVIAEKLDAAGDDDDGVILVLERLGNIESSLAALFVRLDSLVELVSAPPVVVVEPEVIEEPDPAPGVVIEAEDESTVVVEQEEVPEVITPQIKKKKARRWL